MINQEGKSEIIDITYFVTNENFEKYNKNFNIVSLVVNPGLRNIFQEEKIKDEIGTILLYGREYFQAISFTRKNLLFLNGEYNDFT